MLLVFDHRLNGAVSFGLTPVETVEKGEFVSQIVGNEGEDDIEMIEESFGARESQSKA